MPSGGSWALFTYVHFLCVGFFLLEKVSRSLDLGDASAEENAVNACFRLSTFLFFSLIPIFFEQFPVFTILQEWIDKYGLELHSVAYSSS